MCFNGGGGGGGGSGGSGGLETGSYSLAGLSDELNPFRTPPQERAKTSRGTSQRTQTRSPVANLGIFAPQVPELEPYRHDKTATRLPVGVYPTYQVRGTHPQAVPASINPYLPRVG